MPNEADNSSNKPIRTVDTPIFECTYYFPTGFWSALGSTFLIVLVSGAIYFPIKLLFSSVPWLATWSILVSIVLAILVVSVIRDRIAGSRFHAAVAPHAADVPAALQAALPCISRGRAEQFIPKLAQILVSNGVEDVVVRISSDAAPPPINPLTIEFEPTPLVEDDEGFRQLAATGEQTAGQDTSSPRSADESFFWRIRRAFQTASWSAIFCAVIASLEWVNFFYTGRLHCSLLFWTGGAVLTFDPSILTGAKRFHAMAVPGGLLRRAGVANDLHLFRRTASILIVFPMGEYRWAAAVCDPFDQFLLWGTRAELEFLLRAWLSPLPPPGPEMLSEL